MSKNILFLDIDGVLNNEQTMHGYGFDAFDPVCLQNFNMVCKVVKTPFSIVISSTWRIMHDFDDLIEIFKKQGFKFPELIIGETPYSRDIMHMTRGDEIGQWIDKHKPDGFIILDDDDDMGPFMGNLVRTKGSTGFTGKVVEVLINKLNKL